MRARLRVGCIRRQHRRCRDRRGLPAAPGLRHGMPARFPVRKTGSAFAKPVDPILGQTIPFAAIGAVRRQDQRPDSHPDRADAGYFSRNGRAIEVLIDRDAVASSAAATDGIWQHHELDPGY